MTRWPNFHPFFPYLVSEKESRTYVLILYPIIFEYTFPIQLFFWKCSYFFPVKLVTGIHFGIRLGKGIFCRSTPVRKNIFLNKFQTLKKECCFSPRFFAHADFPYVSADSANQGGRPLLTPLSVGSHGLHHVAIQFEGSPCRQFSQSLKNPRVQIPVDFPSYHFLKNAFRPSLSTNPGKSA